MFAVTVIMTTLVMSSNASPSNNHIIAFDFDPMTSIGIHEEMNGSNQQQLTSSTIEKTQEKQQTKK